jgi:hypothetical protein
MRICPDALFEVGLNRLSPIRLDEEARIANEGANPVAPDLNNTGKLRATMRSLTVSASKGAVIGRSRDPFRLAAE